MKLSSIRWIATAALSAAAALPATSFAQATWNLGASTCGSGGGTTYNTLTCTGSGTTETATMQAFGTTGGSGTALTTGTLANWDPSGFGAYVGTDTGSPQHAFDSTNPAGSTEMMLIGFGPYKVNLTSVALGWYSTDADVSILRWDGAYMSQGEMANLISGKTTSGLMSAGWTLVGSESLTTANFNNPNTSGATSYAAANNGTVNDAGRSTINLGTTTSSYWMISTYFGATSGNLNNGDDNFKILNFAGTVSSVCADPTKTGANCTTPVTNPVPEPGSLALVGLALAGVYAARRRRQQAA